MNKQIQAVNKMVCDASSVLVSVYLSPLLFSPQVQVHSFSTTSPMYM